MLTLFNVIAVVLISIGVFLIFGLSPERIGNDLMNFIHKEQSLSRRVALAQGSAKRSKLQSALLDVYNALVATKSENKFAVLFTFSILAFVGGCLFSVIAGNVIFIPVFGFLAAVVPYAYAKSLASYYNKKISEELETALSIVTTAYISHEDILYAVESSIDHINEPVKHIFKEFLGKTKLINSNVKLAIAQMKDSINNEVFREWCDNLIECQDNSTLKKTLQPITARLSDIRVVNAELEVMLMNPRKEFIIMLLIVIGNIPLLYFMNRDWGSVLFGTLQGQIALGTTAVVGIICTVLMLKVTQPLEYKR